MSRSNANLVKYKRIRNGRCGMCKRQGETISELVVDEGTVDPKKSLRVGSVELCKVCSDSMADALGLEYPDQIIVKEFDFK